ncbi:hypothetical protein ACHHYP_00181 [Achlya hypogyna]|uniref:Choline transporter-like protein n=1 Tax=Achlya hypogyna TaxID=1202772 RepID=A0A1V9ZB60_ACHHY|nr:hypothetical protein ACHHYP_00181 [Achlya hypogyna]
MQVVVVPVTDEAAVVKPSAGTVPSLKLTAPPPETGLAQYRDWPFAALFVGHVVAILVVALGWGIPVLEAGSRSNSTSTTVDPAAVGTGIGILAAMFVLAMVLSGAMVLAVVKFPGSIIVSALWFNLTLFILIAGLGIATGLVILAVIGILAAAIYGCYMFSVRNRIPFATANLGVAAAAVHEIRALFPVSITIVVVQVLWTVLWLVALIGLLVQLSVDRPAVPTIIMCLSLHWGISVIKNVNHTMIAGSVAGWWYAAGVTSTQGALKRCLTTSFGSICLGSLLVALLETLKLVLDNTAKNGGVAAVIAQCLVGCILSLLELYNRWAFVYVGVYGFNFAGAGRAVTQLFKTRGFTTIINDDLISSALLFSAFVVGLVCGGLATAFTVIQTTNAATLAIVGIAAFGIGVAVAAVALGVVDSAVATVYVCFAEVV